MCSSTTPISHQSGFFHYSLGVLPLSEISRSVYVCVCVFQHSPEYTQEHTFNKLIYALSVQYQDEKPQRLNISLFHFNMCKGSKQHAMFQHPSHVDGKLLNEFYCEHLQNCSNSCRRRVDWIKMSGCYLREWSQVFEWRG